LSTLSFPLLIESRPAIACKIVDFPLPLGPIIAVIFPAGMVKSEAEIATRDPRVITTLWAETMSDTRFHHFPSS
jgi:hypothetical protein